MSGIEVVGIVLGALPVLVELINGCRESLEPLVDWYQFESRFIELVGELRIENMKYRRTIIKLLDPLIPDTHKLQSQTFEDHRWKDGSLTQLVRERMGEQFEEFVRISESMQSTTIDLRQSLSHSQHKGWYPLARFKYPIFKKSWRSKIKQLAQYNRQLEEILGYSDIVTPIAERRKLSPPVTFLDQLRNHASSLHSAIKQHWKCPQQVLCRSHSAHLSLRSRPKEVDVGCMDVIFTVSNPCANLIVHEITVTPVQKDITAAITTLTIGDHAETPFLKTLQADVAGHKNRHKEPGVDHTRSSQLTESVKTGRTSVRFADNQSSTMTVTATPPCQVTPDSRGELCSSLTCSSYGRWDDPDNAQAYDLKRKVPGGPWQTAPKAVRLRDLHDLLAANEADEIELDLRQRLNMAIGIAASLLQLERTPWLSIPTPSKEASSHFLFLADDSTLHSDESYVSQAFMSPSPPPDNTQIDLTAHQIVDKLAAIGILLLEVLFGRRIASCKHRARYCSPDGVPHRWTDTLTALDWQRDLERNFPAEIAHAVWRCLRCGFGPAPDLKDKRFKEAYYEGVIKPLEDARQSFKEQDRP